MNQESLTFIALINLWVDLEMIFTRSSVPLSYYVSNLGHFKEEAWRRGCDAGSHTHGLEFEPHRGIYLYAFRFLRFLLLRAVSRALMVLNYSHWVLLGQELAQGSRKNVHRNNQLQLAERSQKRACSKWIHTHTLHLALRIKCVTTAKQLVLLIDINIP